MQGPRRAGKGRGTAAGWPAVRRERAAQRWPPSARATARPRRGRDERTARHFYVQFPAGLSALVQAYLVAELKAQVESADDSSVTLTAVSTLREISALPYLKNAFQVLGRVPRRALGNALEGFAEAAAQGRLTIPPEGMGRPFRLMAHIDGQLAAMPKPARTQLERAIGKATRSQVAARGSCDEYWVIARRDLDTYLLARRGSTSRQTDSPPAGALAPELADLLIRMAAPDPRDRFLDPFAGSHALAKARSHYPARSILSSDLSGTGTAAPAALRAEVTVLRDDALLLPSVDDHSVDVIVTDPPWGDHEEVGDLAGLLDRMWASFDRVLSLRTPRVVVLMTRSRVPALLASAESAGYRRDTAYDLLVNGHPASAVLFRRSDARA